MVSPILSDYYRVPDEGLARVCAPQLSGENGFFNFGPDVSCYGKSSTGVSPEIENAGRFDAYQNASLKNSEVQLSFDPVQVVENLLRERYVKQRPARNGRMVDLPIVRSTYYAVRELLPVSIRKHLQKFYLGDWSRLLFPRWPVDFTVDTLHERILRLSMQANGIQRMPFIWFWPNGAPNALIVTHDVETAVGRDFTSALIDLDEAHGIRASFQVIPEKRYEVTDEYVALIRNRGFEFNIHDLNHDGQLYQERQLFLQRSKKINSYVKKFATSGFRAGVMYRNLDWYDAYEMSYDMSMPNVAHLEPQRGGCCTVFPYFVGKILEIPLTTCQDYSLFQILNDYSIDLWKQQLALLRKRYGLMSFIAHPDYLIDANARRVYESLLQYLQQMVEREKIWMALPGEVDQWWRARHQMRLVQTNGQWVVEGPQSDKAKVAFAVLDGDSLRYQVTS